MKRVKIVIPTYNEEQNITAVLKEICTTLDQFPQFEFSLYIYNDGSTDRSGELIDQFLSTPSLLFETCLIENTINKGTVYSTKQLYQIALSEPLAK